MWMSVIGLLGERVEVRGKPGDFFHVRHRVKNVNAFSWYRGDVLIRKPSSSIVRILDYDKLVSSEHLHHAPTP